MSVLQTKSHILCLAAWIFMSAVAYAETRPNIVILLADDLGWKDIGCYDGPVKTPALDGLAAGGARFTDFHSGAAVCSPSRATLLTGRTNLRAGVYSWIHDHNQNSHLLEREVTLAEVLKSHGYETAHLGKWHLGLPTRNRKKPTPAEHGFDYWFATGNNAQPSHKNPANLIRNGEPVGQTSGYACQVIIDEAIKWLDQKRNSDKPFLLNVWFHEPHAPIAAPSEIVSEYGVLKDPAAIYSGTIDNTDRSIKRLLEKIAEVDAPENTLIVYSSDNGSYRADRVGHLRATKGSNYEGGIRVPGIFYWPGTITKGLVEDEPAGLIDLLPTVCGLIGIDKPPGVHLDGSDLSPLLTGRAGEFVRHQPLFWLLPASGPCIALRDRKFSLVGHRTYEFPRDQETMAALKKQIEMTLRRNGTWEEEIRGSTLDKQMFEGFRDKQAEKLRGQFIQLNMFNESWIPTIKSGSYGRYELFDMSKDSGQTTDVSKQHPEVFARLKKQLLEINASVMSDAPDWIVSEQFAAGGGVDKPIGKLSPKTMIEEKTKVHRLKSAYRSPFDAFVYVNRIPSKPNEGESHIDLAGRIFGRLANQEGRILVKLPPGMNPDAYLGFKKFLRYEGTQQVGNCAACHRLPDFTMMPTAADDDSEQPATSLRNLNKSQAELRKTIMRKLELSLQKDGTDTNDAYAAMKLDDRDIRDLTAFLSQLNDVSDKEFRELILNATVLDTSGDVQ